MRIEIDESTLALVLSGALVGWVLYKNPGLQEPALWAMYGSVTVASILFIIYMVSMMTELMLFDALWKYTRGDSSE